MPVPDEFVLAPDFGLCEICGRNRVNFGGFRRILLEVCNITNTSR